VPSTIASFLAVREGAQVTLYRYAQQRNRVFSAKTFHGWRVIESAELSPEASASLTALLASREAYTSTHYGCGDHGIGLRLRRNHQQLDVFVNLICRHIYDPESGDEIGYLSTTAQAYVVQLAKLVHASP
jgi:hypothetical protein